MIFQVVTRAKYLVIMHLYIKNYDTATTCAPVTKSPQVIMVGVCTIGLKIPTLSMVF